MARPKSIALIVLALALAACGGADGSSDVGQEADVTGIRAHFYLDSSGQYSQTATYSGTVVALLTDGTEVVALCNEHCLREVDPGVPDSFFDIDPSWSGQPLVAVFDPPGARPALLAQNDSGDWEVIEVLDDA